MGNFVSVAFANSVLVNSSSSSFSDWSLRNESILDLKLSWSFWVPFETDSQCWMSSWSSAWNRALSRVPKQLRYASVV